VWLRPARVGAPLHHPQDLLGFLVAAVAEIRGVKERDINIRKCRWVGVPVKGDPTPWCAPRLRR
jgi:hypothetical protein